MALVLRDKPACLAGRRISGESMHAKPLAAEPVFCSFYYTLELPPPRAQPPEARGASVRAACIMRPRLRHKPCQHARLDVWLSPFLFSCYWYWNILVGGEKRHRAVDLVPLLSAAFTALRAASAPRRRRCVRTPELRALSVSPCVSICAFFPFPLRRQTGKQPGLHCPARRALVTAAALLRTSRPCVKAGLPHCFPPRQYRFRPPCH